METRQLVDIINQQDFRYDLRGEKLGQAMINLGFNSDNSEFEFYLLPFFRTQPFARPPARPRVNLPIAESASIEGNRDRRVDIAARWYMPLSKADFAISAFSGYSRDPILKPKISNHYSLEMEPFYSHINQIGFEFVSDYEQWLFKTESYYRHGQHTGSEKGIALGTEYSVGSRDWLSIAQLQPELSIYLEYFKDNKHSGRFNTQLYQQSVMLGGRLSLNGSYQGNLKLALIHDIDNRGDIVQLELEYLYKDHWQLTSVMQSISSHQNNSAFSYIEDEDWILLRLAYLF